MPTIRGRERGRRRDERDGQRRAALLSGHDYFGVFRNEQERGWYWRLWRSELLGEWIGQHPGTRPAAWWTFDAPERRRRIDGKPHPFDNPEREEHLARTQKNSPAAVKELQYALTRGVPRMLILRDDFGAEYEAEYDYLHRLGLLVPGETERVQP